MKTEVFVNIIDSIAEIRFVQEYENQEKQPIEAIYQFPTSSEFAVTSMHVKIDDKEVMTKIMEKNEA